MTVGVCIGSVKPDTREDGQCSDWQKERSDSQRRSRAGPVCRCGTASVVGSANATATRGGTRAR